MEPRPHPDARSIDARPPGLLVVTIDHLPAWMLAAYGATWVATPALDGLAARGVVLDRVITPSPTVHDALSDLAAAASPPGSNLLAAAATAGWRPVVVTDDAGVASAMTAVAAVPADGVRFVEAMAKVDVERDDAETNIAKLVDAAIEVIDTGAHRMVWCHVGSLGVAWDAPDRYRERYIDPDDPPPPSGARVPGFAVHADTDPDLVVGIRQVFAGQVTLLDSQLGRLFDAVRTGKTAGTGPWAVLVVGVRGLPLGLHEWVGLGGPAIPYGELVHVPAIVVDAAGRMAAQRYGGLVIPADLGATLADLVMPHDASASLERGDNPSAPWRGRSLAPLFETWSVPVRDRVIVQGPYGAAIVTPAWHGVLPSENADGPTRRGAQGRVRLFAKPDDFFELADVANRCSDVAGTLEGLLEQVTAGSHHAVWQATLPEATGG